MALPRSFIAFIVVALVIAGGVWIYVSSLSGDETQRSYRVGILSGASFFANTADGFRAGMTELGYVEGKNVSYDVRATDIDPAAYQDALRAFVADNVDLIYSFPTEASLEAKAAGEAAGIPVVFSIANIEDNTLVASIREPGGLITGVRYPGPDLTITRLEIMRELLPGADKFVVFENPDYPVVPGQLKILRPAMEEAGLSLIEVMIPNGASMEAIIAAKEKAGDFEGADAVLLIDGPVTVTPETFALIGAFARGKKIPMGGMPQFVGEYQSLYGVSTDNFATGKQASLLADKVFKGIPAGTIPVVSAESNLKINYKEAERLGVKIPEGLLSRANEIIR